MAVCNCCGKEFDGTEYITHDDEIICEHCLNTEHFTCEDCGDIFHNNLAIGTEDGYCCQTCVDTDYSFCEHCVEYVQNDDINFVTDVEEYWCDRCVENNATSCFACGDIVTMNDTTEVDGQYICQSCIDNGDFLSCENCGSIHHCDDMEYVRGDYYCRDCAEDAQGVIGEYHSHENDDLVFHGCSNNNTVPYLGVELEIDKGRNNNETAEKILGVMPEKFIFMEYDGSLDDGFENITHPATLEYHTSIAENYKKMFKICVHNGFRSHDTRTCGLHVHFNRDFFGGEQDECITRLLYLTERFWDEMIKFSRRRMGGISRWANKYDREPVEIVADMKSHRLGRYYAVNLTNSNTIEFRMFRGTLKFETYIATLQLVNNLVVTAKEVTEPEKLQALTWADFINTDELRAYWEQVKDREVK